MSMEQSKLLLENENMQLEEHIKLLEEKLKEQDLILLKQSKQASVGEMIENVAHQWRQPLMAISTLLMNTEAKIKFNQELSNKDLLKMIEKSNEIIKFMSNTITDFRDFFSKNKKKEDFLIAEQLSLCINIIKSELTKNKIKTNIIIKNNIKVYGLKNEYAQVLLNIIMNAKDSIVSNKTRNGVITILVQQKNNKIIVSIEDNGGGIDIDPIEKVFEQFFTVNKLHGTGIGLFMSQLIIQKNMNGELLVENKRDGACFTVILPCE